MNCFLKEPCSVQEMTEIAIEQIIQEISPGSFGLLVHVFPLLYGQVIPLSYVILLNYVRHAISVK